MNPLQMKARQRIAAMKELQTLALTLFRKRGFGAEKVEDLASEAGTSPSTIYRYFGTKEGILLWDDFDIPVAKAMTKRLLLGDSPKRALREAFCVTLADRIAADGAAHLERIRFIYETPEIHGAAIRQQLDEVDSLAKDFAELLEVDDAGFSAQVLSATCSSVLDATLKRWIQESGELSLNELMAAAFDAIAWRD